MIQKVSFRNFKAYRSLDMELEPFTVLVGPNASGKTTLLEGLHLISDVAGEQPTRRALFGDPPVVRTRDGLLTRGATAAIEVWVLGRWEKDEVEVTIKGTERRLPEANGRKQEWSFDVSRKKPGSEESSGLSPALRRHLRSTMVLRFEPRRLAEPSYSEEEIPRVASDGSGLASVLAHLKLTDDSLFDAIEEELTRIVPNVERVRVERAAVELTALRTLSLDEQRHEVSERRTLWGNRIVFDMKGAQGVSADAAGEGTLMALGLLAVVMGPAQPKLILLDDIELSLHPVAQGKLIEVLRKLQGHDPELQVVATSHSPFILNYLDPKEVRMTFLAENGFARCEKLTAHPEFEKWKDMMTPGEFWSTVGESWLEKAGETRVHE